MLTRRNVLATAASLGFVAPVLARALAQEADGRQQLTREMIQNAQWVSGIELTEAEQEELVQSVNSLHDQLKQLNTVPLDPQWDDPAIDFQVLGANDGKQRFDSKRNHDFRESIASVRPESREDLAFLSVAELSALIRNRMVSSRELTELYLNRLERFNPMLKCVVTLTRDHAMRAAERADQEIQRGKYRGPLHGIPWGAKDLISVPGYPTTWGIPVFKERIFDRPATVYQRLEDAGAVLVAKLSLGAIAMGDQWFEGMTRNPWNPRTGSSGSSAGSASATSAGLVGFSLGSETLGSILSPSMRCGTFGLRPTFGRVSRHGCMPLSFTMDKIGPIAQHRRLGCRVWCHLRP
ncbi:MAG: amidase [Pirellulaceae bacterium]